MKHRARELVLEAGKAALFRFRGGDRSANAVITQAHLEAMVSEIAPTGAVDEIRAGNPIDFVYANGIGASVRVVVAETAGGGWRASVTPHAVETVVEPVALELGIPMLDPTGSPARAVSRPPVGGRGARSLRPSVRHARPDRTLVMSDGGERRPVASAAAAAPRAIAIRTGGEPRLYGYLRQLAAAGGSDLHLSAQEIPRCRVHGEIRPLEPGHPKITDAEMRTLLWEVAPERAQKQFETLRDADFGLSIEGLARFRANYFEDRKGMGAVFRQIPFEILTPEQLGLPKAVLDLCWLSKGLVVVTGPTGSGKSTTLASLIDFVNRNRSDHIVTIEDPIEFVHENHKCLVNQREIGAHTESFQNALRAALREDPDIVLVGEMRDLETIAIAIETAETGHLVFGTLHTTTAASTVDRIIDQFPADRQAQIRTMLSESLRGVIAQVLCKKIQGGRAAAYEVLLTNAAVSNLIREGKTFQLVSTMQTAKGSGMQTMNDHLADLVKRRIVHAREAYIKSTDKTGLKEIFKRENIQLELGG
ncbi:MAG: type IV pilus twitching motility protein PilT [Polyangiaceae bacterium]|nr:type IV pilus twitching motility protein PilT [Polyangiaceae bacterium]